MIWNHKHCVIFLENIQVWRALPWRGFWPADDIVDGWEPCAPEQANPGLPMQPPCGEYTDHSFSGQGRLLMS